ncbi:MAG: ABC transporter ATP-binding protein [Anaerolineaceae bacterium]
MLSLRGIRKQFEGRWLLDNVDLAVDQGEILGLLGESGSGKSTLLRIIAGLEEAEAGQILWDGQDITKLEPHRRGFGLMFQDYALFPHRTVAQNIAFGLRMQGMKTPELDSHVAKALETIRMSAFANRPVTELSGGEQQRVALARALAPNPNLLMLDEPLGALDHALRVGLMHELRSVLSASGKPAIYVTHDREEAFASADRLAVLHNGHIIQSGTPQELFDHPANAWLAGFLALGNLLPARVACDNSMHVSTSIGGFTLSEPCSSDPGGECMLLIRPQDLQIGLTEASGANSFQTRVIDSVFMGEFWHLQLESAGVNLDARSPKPYPAGSEITVSISPDRLQLLNN